MASFTRPRLWVLKARTIPDHGHPTLLSAELTGLEHVQGGPHGYLQSLAQAEKLRFPEEEMKAQIH